MFLESIHGAADPRGCGVAQQQGANSTPVQSADSALANLPREVSETNGSASALGV